MTGTLGLFSLVDLFQLLSGASVSGRLTVEGEEGQARIYFEAGRAVHAQFGSLSGHEAIYSLMAREEGNFEFVLGVPAPEASIDTSVETLVLEASRRLDESRRDPTPVDMEMVLDFGEGASAGSLKLSPEQVNLLRHVDGRRSLAELAGLAGIQPELARETAQRLLRSGALKLSGRRARTARLVARLSREKLPHATVGVDESIVRSWQQAVGATVSEVACRRPDGTTCALRMQAVPDAGPYLLASRDTLIFANLHVDQPLLVRPYLPQREAAG